MLQRREPPLPASSDFLGSLEESERETLHALGRLRTCARGEYLFRVGDPGAHVYFLAQGRVKIVQPADSGREVKPREYLVWQPARDMEKRQHNNRGDRKPAPRTLDRSSA